MVKYQTSPPNCMEQHESPKDVSNTIDCVRYIIDSFHIVVQKHKFRLWLVRLQRSTRWAASDSRQVCERVFYSNGKAFIMIPDIFTDVFSVLVFNSQWSFKAARPRHQKACPHISLVSMTITGWRIPNNRRNVRLMLVKRSYGGDIKTFLKVF